MNGHDVSTTIYGAVVVGWLAKTMIGLTTPRSRCGAEVHALVAAFVVISARDPLVNARWGATDVVDVDLVGLVTQDSGPAR